MPVILFFLLLFCDSASEELAPKFFAAMSNAKLPDPLFQKLQTAFEENPAFVADMLVCHETDRHLRKLVDKHYPIPKDHVPADLVVLEGKSYKLASKGMLLRPVAAEALNEMATAAQADGVVLYVRSAFRPYRIQDGIYQTGLVVDFSANSWLSANASRFGWSLHESRNYRYVGKDIAAFIDNYFDGVQYHALRFLHEWKNILITDVNILMAKFDGSFIVAGMPAAEYDAAINAKWQQISYPEEKPLDLNYEINKKYTYEEYESFILNLSRYDYVTVYSMGKTVENRTIYSIEIFNSSNVDSSNADSSKAHTIMINAGTHANETMGPHAALKMAESFIKQAQENPTFQEHLKQVKITILPCLNPDGRELIYADNNILRKSNALGIDINKAFPSINAGVLRIGKKHPTVFSDTAGDMYYPGEYLGKTQEAAIAIKWMNHYILNENAQIILDLHQKGNNIFYGKPFDINSRKPKQKEFYDYLRNILRTKGSPVYSRVSDSENYGYDGTGGTLTDYAYGVAMGLQYSGQYGRQAVIIEGREATLLEMESLNDYADHLLPVNVNFVHATIEMTDKDNDHKGFLRSTLNAQQTHYNEQNYDNLLANLIKWVLNNKQKI